MRYSGLIINDFVNGEGVCTSLFLQGCPFHCEGCHNPETWDFNGGIEIEEEELINKVINALNTNNIDRNLSILGGEPLCAQNLDFTTKISQRVKILFPNKKIYIWTGFEFTQLLNNPKAQTILELADVLITGQFILSQRDITLPLRGSSNQEIWRRNINNKLTLSKN